MAIAVLLALQFDRLHALQRVIPAPFEFIGHQAILWIGELILLLSPPGTIAGRFQIPMQRRHHLVDLACLLFARHYRSLDCSRLHHAKYLAGNRLIDDKASESDALGLAIIELTPQH